MKKHFESFNVGIALIEFEKFFWNEFFDNYLEIIKGKKLFETDKKIINSSKYGLYHSFLNIIKLISPILPHISEEIYQNIFKKYEDKISICETNYPESEEKNEENEEIKYLFETIDLIRKFKAENNIKYSQMSNKLNIFSDKNDILKNFHLELKAISRTENIDFINSNKGEKVEIS